MLTSEDQTINAREPEINSLKTDESDSWKNEPAWYLFLREFLNHFIYRDNKRHKENH